ncbi:raftlin [Gouania willdenowi]|uniref:Raftlin n=1 Tax=Gouania willdenowi TaxID=441366 RepID=A0A8C5EHD9_GOUWI|nr:raftlin [Gouania willdenowi]
MGCGLKKMKPVSEENSQGKIYSTLKRPQVESKVGVAYTYRYLDFLIGRDGGTSTLRLSSVRELPGQLQELYQQGFVLAAVHPFIHPCGPESNSPQHQLYRAVLVRTSDGNQSLCSSYRLQLEDCLSAEQQPSAELIQGYVKKQIQDAAEQGVMFVGFVQEPYGAPCSRIRDLDTPSLSLHSSPSSVLGSLPSCSPQNHGEPATEVEAEDKDELEVVGAADVDAGNIGSCSLENGWDEASAPGSPVSELTEDDSSRHNNNRDGSAETKGRPRYRPRRGDGAELLALYNHPTVREGQAKYYTVKVPLRVHNNDEGIKGVDANWLDHMTQHFNNGASLVDGYFHLGNLNDLLPKSVQSVFIFQEAREGATSAIATGYDAIVVEQWTVIDGLQVKADYVPLLQSLAAYGWRLTCVLPTPVVKTNSDGSLSTKQIVFLQRPVVGRKKKEPKKLIFKPRGKAGKNCIKDTTKNKKRKKKKTPSRRGAEDARVPDEERGGDGRVNVEGGEEQREEERHDETETKEEESLDVEIATEDRDPAEMLQSPTETKEGGAKQREDGEEGEEEREEEKDAQSRFPPPASDSM